MRLNVFESGVVLFEFVFRCLPETLILSFDDLFTLFTFDDVACTPIGLYKTDLQYRVYIGLVR